MVSSASSHALWRALSNEVTWVLGHCRVDTPHIHTFEGDSVLSKFVVCSPPSRSSRIMTRIIQTWKRFVYTVSVKICTELTSTILCIHTSGCMCTRQSPTLLWPQQKKWTFGSGSLLCQKFRRRHEEMARKRRKMETSLVIMIFLLHVLTYVVSYKLFWNWIGVVQFIPQEVWFDRGLVNWHFLHYCLVQTVLLRAFGIGVLQIWTPAGPS